MLLSDLWYYDRFCTPKTAARLANVYLSSCLANQTFTQVALVDGVPVGIAMGKNRASHFTDTSCNYGFYEHQGMKRQQEKKHCFDINGLPGEMSFFLYDYSCSEGK